MAGAADLIRHHGVAATSIRDLARHTGAPLGSIYHHFPGGKEQLVTEAIQYAGDTVTAILRKELQPGPAEGLRALLALWRHILTSSDFRAGCPVLAVAIEESAAEEIPAALTAAAAEFTGWQTLLAGALREHGADDRQATQVAALIVAAVEGATAMCRAARSTHPLDQITPQLETLTRATISTRTGKRSSP